MHSMNLRSLALAVLSALSLAGCGKSDVASRLEYAGEPNASGGRLRCEQGLGQAYRETAGGVVRAMPTLRRVQTKPSEGMVR